MSNKDKAVLTDEQIHSIYLETIQKNPRLFIDSPGFRNVFAKAIEAAVLASADNPSTASDELHIGVSNNDQGVHINIMQRHADGTATVIYSANAPAGDSYGRAGLAAPVAQSTTGGAKGGNAIDVKHEFEMWASKRGESAVYIGDGLYQSSSVTDQAEAFAAGVELGRAAPALNPSEDSHG